MEGNIKIQNIANALDEGLIATKICCPTCSIGHVGSIDNPVKLYFLILLSNSNASDVYQFLELLGYEGDHIQNISQNTCGEFDEDSVTTFTELVGEELQYGLIEYSSFNEDGSSYLPEYLNFLDNIHTFYSEEIKKASNLGLLTLGIIVFCVGDTQYVLNLPKAIEFLQQTPIEFNETGLNCCFKFLNNLNNVG